MIKNNIYLLILFLSVDLIGSKNKNMKGISFLTNEKSEIKSIVIDLKTIYANVGNVHSFINTLVEENLKKKIAEGAKNKDKKKAKKKLK